MEIDMLRTIRVSTLVSNLPRGITNRVSINHYEEIEELIEYESGMVRNLGSHRSPLATNTHIISFTGPDLSQLLNDQVVPYARALGQRIAHDVNEYLANDTSLREPLFVTVNVIFFKQRRLIMPRIVFPPSLLSRGASGEVLQRLVEEQRVESVDLEKEDETCSICIENLSESRDNITRMPDCLHMLHQDCLFECLGRQTHVPCAGKFRTRRKKKKRASVNLGGFLCAEILKYIRFLEG